MNKSILRAIPLAIALTAALGVNAQSANPSGPGNTNSNKAGEAYPGGPTTSQPAANSKVADTVVKTENKVANSRPAKATKKGVKKASNAVKNAGTKTANAIRNTGNKINEKVPPGPEDGKK